MSTTAPGQYVKWLQKSNSNSMQNWQGIDFNIKV